MCGRKWPARHSKLSTRAKIDKLQILRLWTEQGFLFHIMYILELASHGAHAQSTF
jgi:hypothetical protein